jgi:hypothetical protein
MGKPSMGHGVGHLRLQSLGLQACLLGLLDRQICGGLCLLQRAIRLVAEFLLLTFLGVCHCGISRSCLCRSCLLGAITGSGSRRFRLQRFAGLADLLQPVLAAPQLLGQITAQLSLAVLAFLLRIQDLGPAHQLLDLLLQLSLGSLLRRSPSG